MNLYQIAEDLETIINNESPDVEMFEKLQGEFNTKLENIVKYMKNQEAMAEATAIEIKRLQEIQKSYSTKASKIEDYIDSVLRSAGINKLELPTSKLSYRMSQAVQILDEDKIPALYRRTKEVKSIDKIAIKEAIQCDIFVEGATIIENKNLQIK